MWPYYLVGAAIVALALVIVLTARKKPTAPADATAQLRDLIKTGVAYEEEFIETYFHVIRDEGFMEHFGPHKDEAKQLLTTMIEESKGHKQLLDNVLANLK